MRERGYCGNPACGVGPVDLYGGRCRPCYQWSYRHDGTARPIDVVIRSSAMISARLVRAHTERYA